MYCNGDIIEINENYRLMVGLDHDSESPLEWGWGTEIIEIDNYRIWMGWEDPADPLAYAAYAAQQQVRSGRWSDEQRDRAIQLFAHWLGETRSFEVQEWRGYSKSDWATVLVIWDEDLGANVYESWAAWRRGDVYIVIEQIRKVYVAQDDPNDTYEDWFDGDVLGGCYLDEGYTAEDVAKEYFSDYPKTKED